MTHSFPPRRSSDLWHQDNRRPLYRAASGSIDEARPPLDDDIIRYYGQYVALVVADTPQQAQAAANAVRVGYAAQPPDISTPSDEEDTPNVESERGDPAAAYDSTQVRKGAEATATEETDRERGGDGKGVS